MTINSNIKSKISCQIFESWKKNVLHTLKNFLLKLFHCYKDQAFDQFSVKERWEAGYFHPLLTAFKDIHVHALWNIIDQEY